MTFQVASVHFDLDTFRVECATAVLLVPLVARLRRDVPVRVATFLVAPKGARATLDFVVAGYACWLAVRLAFPPLSIVRP